MNPVEVVVYTARDQRKASEEFAKDSAKWARKGYVPVSQSWGDGRTGCLRFIMLGGIGSLVIKPKGTLTVTYRHDPVAAGIATPKPEPQAPWDRIRDAAQPEEQPPTG